MSDSQRVLPSTTGAMTPTLALRDIGGVAKRNLLRIARTPQMLVIGALQPALMLVLFRYVLGGAIQVPGGRYVDYVVPAVFLEAVLIGGMTTSIGLAQDLHSGIIDRFRSLPMARSAVLAGRTLADISRSLVSLAIMIGLGLLVGFRFHNDAGSIIAGIALIMAFGYAFSWVYATIGLATKDPETAQVAGILPFFILMFAIKRDRSRLDDARLAAGLRAQPATQCHRRRRSRPARRRPGRTLGLAVTRVVSRNHTRVPRDRPAPLSHRHHLNPHRPAASWPRGNFGG